MPRVPMSRIVIVSVLRLYWQTLQLRVADGSIEDLVRLRPDARHAIPARIVGTTADSRKAQVGCSRRLRRAAPHGAAVSRRGLEANYEQLACVV